MRNRPHIRRNTTAVLAMFFVAATSTCSKSVPSTETCVRRWNSSTNTANHAEVASGRFSEAIVYGWDDKGGDAACAVVFLKSPNGEWVTFAESVSGGEATQSWLLADSGHTWGTDSPDGGPTSANSRVTSDGGVTPLA